MMFFKIVKIVNPSNEYMFILHYFLYIRKELVRVRASLMLNPSCQH